MKVKFTQSCVGSDFSFPAHKVVDLPDDFALGFVRSGLAVPVEPVVEAAVEPEEQVRVATLPSPKRARR